MSAQIKDPHLPFDPDTFIPFHFPNIDHALNRIDTECEN